MEEGILKINSQCGLWGMEAIEGIVTTIVEGVEDIVAVIETIEKIVVIIEAVDEAVTVEGKVVVVTEVASEEDGEVVTVAVIGVDDTVVLDIAADLIMDKEVLQADLPATSLPARPLAHLLEALEVDIQVATVVEPTMFLLGEV